MKPTEEDPRHNKLYYENMANDVKGMFLSMPYDYQMDVVKAIEMNTGFRIEFMRKNKNQWRYFNEY